MAGEDESKTESPAQSSVNPLGVIVGTPGFGNMLTVTGNETELQLPLNTST